MVRLASYVFVKDQYGLLQNCLGTARSHYVAIRIGVDPPGLSKSFMVFYITLLGTENYGPQLLNTDVNSTKYICVMPYYRNWLVWGQP